jgi:hypothetical protein
MATRAAYSPPPAPDVSPVPFEDARAHKDSALERARNYYRYEHRMGSANIRMTSIDFESNEPKSVTGWPGRYRTEGKALIQYSDGRGSIQSTAELFEVLTEQKPGDSIKVVDFIRKS